MGSMKLYVGNLSWDAKAEDLRHLFSKYGEVEDAFIPLDRETGRSRGFGFVTMDADAAQSAIQDMDGQEFMERNIRVNEAAPQGERPSGGRGRFSRGGGFGGRSRGYGGNGGGRGYGGRGRDSYGSGGGGYDNYGDY